MYAPRWVRSAAALRARVAAFCAGLGAMAAAGEIYITYEEVEKAFRPVSEASPPVRLSARRPTTPSGLEEERIGRQGRRAGARAFSLPFPSYIDR